MRLYVANCTKQKQAICYRLDVDKDGNLKDTNRRFQPHHQQEIEPGRQVQLGSEFHVSQIVHIKEQLSPFGMLDASEIGRLPKKVIPYVCGVDRPVSSKIMEMIRAHNEAVLIESGHDRRQRAAVATNALVTQAVQATYAANGVNADAAGVTDVTFEQQEQSEAGEKRVEEGYTVDPSAKGAPVPGTKSKRRK